MSQALHAKSLLIRDVTERPKTRFNATGHFVGLDYYKFFNEVSILLDGQKVYVMIPQVVNSYDNGKGLLLLLFVFLIKRIRPNTKKKT